MSARFVNVDRNTPMLLPPDLRDWVEDDELVHFVIEAVDRLALEEFRVNQRGTGDAQFPPHMMLSLLIYCYANGIFSSRKIERATYRDVAVRYLTADTHPDHDTICKFRRDNFEAISTAFVDVLELATELKLLSLGKISLDGTHIKANASIDQNVTYRRACEIREQLRIDIDALLAEAEKADAQEADIEKLPDEIARREKLAVKMDRAIEELEKRAAQREQKARAEYEKKLAERAHKEKETGKKCGGRKPKEPQERPEDSSEQCNLSDPDARIMRKNKRSSFTESYNAQAAVDADGSQLIVGAHVSQSASDSRELENGVRSVPDELGTPEAVLADAGYANAEAFDRVQEGLGVEVYCSVHREDAHSERRYDFRPETKSNRPVKKVADRRLAAMKEKLQSEEGKAIYAKRNHTVEPAFGIIKEVMGFRGFLLRGKEKVDGEWTLVCLSYNLKRLHRLRQQKGPKKAQTRASMPKNRPAAQPVAPSADECLPSASSTLIQFICAALGNPFAVALTPTDS
jgi:transposase